MILVARARRPLPAAPRGARPASEAPSALPLGLTIGLARRVGSLCCSSIPLSVSAQGAIPSPAAHQLGAAAQGALGCLRPGLEFDGLRRGARKRLRPAIRVRSGAAVCPRLLRVLLIVFTWSSAVWGFADSLSGESKRYGRISRPHCMAVQDALRPVSTGLARAASSQLLQPCRYV